MKAMSIYDQSWRVFRGIVTKVEEVLEDGVWKGIKIFVRDINEPDESIAQEAYPPTGIATSSTGSGMISIPAPKQECIVAWHPTSAYYQILTYTTSGETNPFGGLSPIRVKEGEYTIKIGGKLKSIFTVAPQGLLRMHSSIFANLEVNGSNKEIILGSKQYTQDFAGGLRYEDYTENDSKTGLSERTDHLEVYYELAGNPGFQDYKNETVESSPLTPDPIRGYTNKTVIKAGSATLNPFWNSPPTSHHQYEVDTRQTTDPATYLTKDTITQTKLGYRAANHPWSTADYEPGGTIIDQRAKRHVLGDAQTYLSRFGKFQGDWATKSVIGGVESAPVPGLLEKDTVQGEIYRTQIYDGLGENIAPLGTPVIDPMGEGKGYEFAFPENTDAMQQYTQSFGALTSPSLLTNTSYLSNSLWRFHVHSRDTLQTGMWVTEQYGGTGTAQDTRHYYKMIESKAASVLNDSYEQSYLTDVAGTTSHLTSLYHLGSQTTNTFSIQSATNALDPHIQLKRDSTANLSLQDFKMSDSPTGNKIELTNTYQSTKTTSVVLENSSTPGGTITLSNSLDNVTLNNGEIVSSASAGATTITQNATDVILANAADSLTLSNGTITLSAGGVSSITVGPSEIVLANPVITMTIGATGVNINGTKLMTEHFLTWFSQSTGMWGLGNMGAPVPMFPPTLATFNVQNALPFLTNGFKSE